MPLSAAINVHCMAADMADFEQCFLLQHASRPLHGTAGVGAVAHAAARAAPHPCPLPPCRTDERRPEPRARVLQAPARWSWSLPGLGVLCCSVLVVAAMVITQSCCCEAVSQPPNRLMGSALLLSAFVGPRGPAGDASCSGSARSAPLAAVVAVLGLLPGPRGRATAHHRR